MGKEYFVVGLFDTRGEIDIKGVTSSEIKAKKWVAQQKERSKDFNMRQWYAFYKTRGI